MGNLNARTGNTGNIQNSKPYEHLEGILSNIDEASDFRMRCSNDLKTNTSDNTLIKLCNNHNFRIANGQIPGDRIGNFTCFNNDDTSVVDYVLAKSPIYKNMTQFKVLPPVFDSKHTPITTTLKASGVTIQKKKLSNPPKVYKCDDQGTTLFRSHIIIETAKYHINTLCNQLKDNNLTSNIQKTAKLFVNFLNDGAAKTLKKNQKQKAKKRLTKPWYNNFCESQKKKKKKKKKTKIIGNNLEKEVKRFLYHS